MPLALGISGPVRQEKTLDLAWVLQACLKRSGVPTGILCDSAQELQKCMAPLMTVSWDDITEASLMKPTKEEHGAFPTTRGGSCPALARNPSHQRSPRPHPSQNTWEIPETPKPSEWIDAQPTESTEQTDALSTSSPAPQSGCQPFWKAKKPWREIGAEPNQTGEWGLHLSAEEWKGARMVEGVLIPSSL